MILGVAFDWSKRKGIDVFADLTKQLDRDKYQIVLVGVGEGMKRALPSDIISVSRTGTQEELAEIYSAADLFVNPTREENFPTVNIEALACGTPVLTFRTGGSPEIPDETCGFVVECNDVKSLAHQIERICNDMPYSKAACAERAANFDKKEKFREYLDLYKAM